MHVFFQPPRGACVSLLAAGTAWAVTDADNTVVMTLKNGGKVVIRLRPDWAPKHVAQIKTLVKRGFYDGLVFHRVIPGFMAQTGDPTGTGEGGSDLPNLKAEFNPEPFQARRSSAWRAPTTGLRQLAVLHHVRATAGFLDGQYTAFGEVVSGMDVVDKIKAGTQANNGAVTNPDKIISMKMAKTSNRSFFDMSAGNTLTLETTKGPIVIELNPAVAQNHVAHIKKLVSEGFYDGVVFHRVIEGFMAQTGCPHGTGTGGSKYPNLKAVVQRRAACARHGVDGARREAPIRPIRSSSSASTTPASSTASTRCGAR